MRHLFIKEDQLYLVFHEKENEVERHEFKQTCDGKSLVYDKTVVSEFHRGVKRCREVGDGLDNSVVSYVKDNLEENLLSN